MSGPRVSSPVPSPLERRVPLGRRRGARRPDSGPNGIHHSLTPERFVPNPVMWGFLCLKG
eukprot:755475-Hanusia_phi.AAC.1